MGKNKAKHNKGNQILIEIRLKSDCTPTPARIQYKTQT